MPRLARLRLLLVLSVLAVTGCAADTQPLGQEQRKETVRLAYDADEQRTFSRGTTIAFDVEPVDGKVPEVQVCGLYGAAASLSPTVDPLPKTDAVLAPVDRATSTYTAVAVGKVGLCGVPAQAIERCQEQPCKDLMGDLRPMVTITVTDG